jgi:hypothetical protein
MGMRLRRQRIGRSPPDAMRMRTSGRTFRRVLPHFNSPVPGQPGANTRFHRSPEFLLPPRQEFKIGEISNGDEFHVNENKKATGTLYGKLTTDPVF